MQLDAAEVRNPREAGGVGDHGKVRLVAGRVIDVDGLEPLGMRIRHPFLIEEVAVDAVRVPLHLHRPLAHVVEHRVGDVDVVLHEIAFGQAALREEDLLRVCHVDLAPSDQHVRARRDAPR